VKHGRKVPKSERRCGDAAGDTRKAAGRPVAGEKPDELQHEDQRAGGRLGKAKSAQHFRRGEPMITLDGLLRDIGQYRISAAERHDSHFREEPSNIGVDAAHRQ